MNRTTTIRTATISDLATLLGLEQAIEGAPHWTEDMWRSMLQEMTDSQRWHIVLIAEQDSTVAGSVAIAGSGDLAELESVAVLPDFRNLGVGRALCLAAMALAAHRGALKMELEVRASSDAPRRLYASLGFAEQGIRKGYYRDPSDDAVLMSAALPVPEAKTSKV